MNIAIKKFGGSLPRLARHLLGETQAAYALDARFEHGTLDAWREPRSIYVAPVGTLTSFQHGCCWLDFPTCVDYALGPITCPDHIYITGNAAYPERVVVDQVTCIATFFRLGLPCPTVAPEVVYAEVVTVQDKDSMGYSYAYQFVNTFDEHSALSPASPVRLARDGSSQVVSAWEIPDASWNVVKVRIFRTVSAVGVGMAKLEVGNEPDTTWMLVGEADINAVFFTASGFTDTLHTALADDIVMPPPAGLRGMIWVESQNTLAGFVGNRIYFSHNYEYHNWPYYIDLDDNICAIAEVNNTLYAMTDGAPYVIQGAADCKQAHLRSVKRLPVAFPMVACGNRHVGRLAQGVVYPSHDGLVLLSGNSIPAIITHPLYAPEDWQKLKPHTVIPEVNGGKLFVFARGGSFVLTLNTDITPGWVLDTHSELSDVNVLDAYTTRTGDLMMLKDNNLVYQWNRGSTLRPYQWHSPVIRSNASVGFAAFRLMMRNGFVDAEIFADGDKVLDETMYRTENLTLPMWAEGYEWEWRLRGTGSVSFLALATGMEDF